jgi:hypothetical protein
MLLTYLAKSNFIGLCIMVNGSFKPTSFHRRAFLVEVSKAIIRITSIIKTSIRIVKTTLAVVYDFG